MKNLSLAALETACWIARLGSFTAAAERLHTTQPAISARVRELESALGYNIFVRWGRGVELTVQGRELVRKAEPLLHQFEELVSGPSTEVAGLIRIGTGNIAMDWLPDAIIHINQKYPKVRFDLEIGRTGHVLTRLEARKLDLAIASGPVDSTKFRTTSLGYDRMLWVASRDLLERNTNLDLPSLLNATPLWCIQRDSFYWDDALQSVIDTGAIDVKLNAIDNMPAGVQLMLHGAGIGLLSATIIHSELESGILQPVPGMNRNNAVEFSISCTRHDPERLVLEIMAEIAAASTFDKSAGALKPA